MGKRHSNSEVKKSKFRPPGLAKLMHKMRHN